MSDTKQGGALMGAEIAESAAVFRRAVTKAVASPPGLADSRAVYTIARGYSDAAAPVLAYEFMRVLNLGQAEFHTSLDSTESRFRREGGTVWRLYTGVSGPLCPAAATALLLRRVYPVVGGTAQALGHDPDHPATWPRSPRPAEGTPDVRYLAQNH